MTIFRDAKIIFNLVRDLTILYHPVTLEIRWRFTHLITYINFETDARTKKDWETVIVNGAGDDGVGKFIHSFIHNDRFRQHIIETLSFEKDYLFKHGEIMSFEERKQNYWQRFLINIRRI